VVVVMPFFRIYGEKPIHVGYACIRLGQNYDMKSLRGYLRQATVLALLCASLLMTFVSTGLAQEGTFVPTGSMSTARELHTATLLNNGKVLIAGGENDTGTVASAELYDPATETFTPTGSMSTARFSHTATLLNNGMVLIAGGLNGPTGVASAELYNPATGIFTATGSMTSIRYDHTATLLNNGQVLVAGGGGVLASAELYDPATGTFTTTGSMNTARFVHTATLLNNGNVLVAGGSNVTTDFLASAELYDPATGTFTTTGSMAYGRAYYTATLLNNGEVLVAGGYPCCNANTSYHEELYEPATGTLTTTGGLNTARTVHTATLLNNGNVLVAGGSGGPFPGGSFTSAELYDPATGTFTTTSSMNTARASHTATLLNNGKVLVAGGNDASNNSSNYLASAELYVPVVVLPASLSFSNQVVGTTSASQTATLTNNQSTALSITSIAFSGTNASDFAETDNCIGSVTAGASCSINVTFTPAALGSRAGSLNIATNVSGNPLTVPLTGTGVAATRIVSLSASSLTFTNQMVGSTSPAQGIALNNTGNSTLTISGLAFSGTNASEFAETDNCGGSVAAGATCTINVTFFPAATGNRTGTLSITNNATSPPSPQTVALTGTATAPSLSVTPLSIAFPAQYVGTSGLPQSITVMNNGNAPLSISSVTTSATDFGTLNACGSTVAAGSSCTIGVFFDPTASGARPGTLTINDNAPGNPHTVALSGTGQDFSLAPVSRASTTVSAGQTANYTVAVSPAGGFNQTVALTCTGGPALSTCAVTPSSVPLNGTVAANVAVSVTTMAALPPLVIPFPRADHRLFYLITELLVVSLLIGLLSWRRRRRPRWAYGFAFLLFLCAGLMSACGGGGSGNQGTPAGTYPLVVSGTFTSGSTSLTHKVNLNLVVQ
jgi:hypothetical protein